METALRKRTAMAACGIALCGALAVPAAMEVSPPTTHSGHVQVDAVRGDKAKKVKKDPKPPKAITTTTASTIS